MNDRERLAHIEQAARNMEGEASMIARLAAELRGRVEEQADSPIAPDVPSARPGEGLGTEGSNPSPASPVKPCEYDEWIDPIDGRTYELLGGNLWVKVADDPLPKGERHMVSPRDAASIVARRPNRRTTSPVKPCPDVPFGSLGNDVEETLDALLGFGRSARMVERAQLRNEIAGLLSRRAPAPSPESEVVLDMPETDSGPLGRAQLEALHRLLAPVLDAAGFSPAHETAKKAIERLLAQWRSGLEPRVPPSPASFSLNPGASKTPGSQQASEELDELLRMHARHDNDDTEDCWTKPAVRAIQYLSDLRWDLQVTTNRAAILAETNESLRRMIADMAAYAGTTFGADEPVKNCEVVKKALAPSPATGESAKGRDHYGSCPRVQAWDHGEYEAPCLCSESPLERALDCFANDGVAIRDADDIEAARAELASLRAEVERLRSALAEKEKAGVDVSIVEGLVASCERWARSAFNDLISMHEAGALQASTFSPEVKDLVPRIVALRTALGANATDGAKEGT